MIASFIKEIHNKKKDYTFAEPTYAGHICGFSWYESQIPRLWTQTQAESDYQLCEF